MYQRIDARAVWRLFRRRLPGPVDVLNLIRFADRDSYRWYGLFVAPSIYIQGGAVLWAARHERSLHGEPPAEELLVVRYPSHRGFLLMTMNPYYALINGLREKGVARFEASFTRPLMSVNGWRGQRRLLAVHYNDPDDGNDARAAVEDCLRQAGCEPVYASREAAPIDVFHRSLPSDPNPLSRRCLVLCVPPEGDGATLETQTLAALDRAARDVSVQLYLREHAGNLLPAPAARLLKALNRRAA